MDGGAGSGREGSPWDKVGDDFLKKVPFPLVSESQLEDSLARLSEAVSG